MEEQKAKLDTIIRSIATLVSVVNEVLIVSGMKALPFTENTVYKAISSIVLIILVARSWWKNNSFTKEAIKADEYLRYLRELKSDSEEDK